MKVGSEVAAIIGVIQSWLDWHKTRRDEFGLGTDMDTAIMSLPVPMWPSHGQLQAWVETLDSVADAIEALEAENESLLNAARNLCDDLIEDGGIGATSDCALPGSFDTLYLMVKESRP